MNKSFIKFARDATRRGPRPAPGRLAAIADAASRVFTRQGFRLSQVADVAREAGVAAGTVYLYAADKAALLDLAIRAAAGLGLPPGDAPAQAELEATLSDALGPRLALPRIAAVAAGDTSAATLRDILGELYDLLAREARLILLLDRLGAEVPQIGAAYGTGLRTRALQDFTRAIGQLAIRGDVRTDLEPGLAARAVLEMIAWMAMRRPGDSAPPAGDEALARETTLRLAEAALALDRRPPSRIRR
ncbi:TetR/AcrR family transcriptional regulator [Neoroseomonas rubea]|uniref:TetR/AcrR family transcriptional regulator n=1 Tax=Neoroseomonas rubea TaxID=2748666 RepID=UPI0018DF44D1|nr:helix-turn-helix domain-containing protein [Roseomonas rubea]